MFQIKSKVPVNQKKKVILTEDTRQLLRLIIFFLPEYKDLLRAPASSHFKKKLP